jgi:hypothetical protein
MSSSSLLDNVYHAILTRLVKSGQAPHFTELAEELKIPVEEARTALHDLMALGIPGLWLFPDTDYISSFAPFSNLPTQYRLTVDREEKWFGQWGFESLAVCWLFPGKVVQIDAPCLDCGFPIHIEIQDGRVLNVVPEETLGYVAVPFSKWLDRLPQAWSTMNLFRSEEHIRNWARFDPATAEGIIPLADVVKVFSGEFFQKRLSLEYVSHRREYLNGFLAAIGEIGKTRPFWALGVH